MSDNVIPFPQKPEPAEHEPNFVWTFDMQDPDGTIYRTVYDMTAGDINSTPVSDGYAENLCQTLCDMLIERPELREYVHTSLERMINTILESEPKK